MFSRSLGFQVFLKHKTFITIRVKSNATLSNFSTNNNNSMDPIPSTLSEAAVLVLNTSDAEQKRLYTLEIVKRWREKSLIEIGSAKPPMHVARPSNVQVVPPKDVPKRGKAGSLNSRIALLHSLVHIENVAIDLSWDIIARFVHYNLPTEFYDDWVKVAEDEALHYGMLLKQLQSLGSHYGALAVHGGLWESAMETAHDLKARLCVEHIVHEGHGLDVSPVTIAKFSSNGDKKSADLLQVILRDEITHVKAGIKWLKYLCEKDEQDAKQVFIETVPKYFKSMLKPPFNKEAREEAGMTEDWYLPLAKSNIRTVLSKDPDTK